MRACVRTMLAVLALPLLAATTVHAQPADKPCTPESCQGLTSFENVSRLVDDIAAERNAALLAYQLGLSLVRQGCCFTEAVAYLRHALNTSPDLRQQFYQDMNRWPAANASALHTRIILAVSSQLQRY